MKKIGNVIICLYIIITIVITYCLLSYNDYNISEFKTKYLLVMEDKNYNYKKSDLLVINKNSRYLKGNSVFYYDKDDSIVTVKIGKIKNVTKVSKDINEYTLEDDTKFNDDSILGSTKNTKIYSLLGSIYSILTSRWGYLIVIIFPMLVAFIYEIYQIIKEIRK